MIERLIGVVDDAIGRAIGQRFAEDGQFAIAFAIGGAKAQARKVGGVARLVGIDRQQQRCFRDLRNRLAVQHDLPADHRDAVPRQRDDALDIVLIAIGWHHDHDIAVFGRMRKQPRGRSRQDVERGRNPRPPIRVFRHHQPIADQQIGHHRSRRDVERLCDQAMKQHDGGKHHHQPAQFDQPDGQRGLGRRYGFGRNLVFGHAPPVPAIGRASITTNACAQG